MAALALGVSLEIRSDLTVAAGEAIVQALAHKTGKVFGNVKVAFDVSCVVVALLCALVCLGGVVAGGGGVAVQRDGTETPLSAQEVADLRAVGVEQRDGRMYLNYYDRTFDLTDLLAEDGTCRVSLQTDDGPLYFDIWDNGASWKNENPLVLGLYTAPD